jgi:hypothetical protein
MAAIAYNLKKMLRYRPKLIQSNLKALKDQLNSFIDRIYIFINLSDLTLQIPLLKIIQP